MARSHLERLHPARSYLARSQLARSQLARSQLARSQLARFELGGGEPPFEAVSGLTPTPGIEHRVLCVCSMPVLCRGRAPLTHIRQKVGRGSALAEYAVQRKGCWSLLRGGWRAVACGKRVLRRAHAQQRCGERSLLGKGLLDVPLVQGSDPVWSDLH